MAPTATATAPQTASLFGLPGVSRPFEMAEVNDGIAITPNASSQVQVTGMVPFTQTDVVRGWRMEVTVNATYAAGTTTLTKSAYFPYNFIGPVKLQYQSQYSPIDVVSGVDLMIFNLIRPFIAGEVGNGRNLIDTSPATLPYSSQANLTSASNLTTSSTSFPFTLDLPASIDLDRFWALDPSGRILNQGGVPVKACVSPQYMAGTSRVVLPQVTLNQLLKTGVGTSDVTPIYGTGSQATPASVGTISGTLGWQRYGWYQPQSQADAPIIWNWQYTRQSKIYFIGGQTAVTIPIPPVGQILSLFVRLFDPSANVVSTIAYGQPIVVNAANISSASITYGPGLFRFQDTPERMQRRFARQHQVLPPEGVLIWDMALGPDGYVSNGPDVLNTLNTSGCAVKLNFVAATSATAYAVLGIEALTYVEAA